MIEAIQDMITTGRGDTPSEPDYGLRIGYYVGASCEFDVIMPANVGPRMANWLAYYMTPKGHSLCTDGLAGDFPADYTAYIQARIDFQDGTGAEGFKADWAVLGFSGECIADAMNGEPYTTIPTQVTNIELMQQIAENVFFSELCPSISRSVPYLYNGFGVTYEEFNTRWNAYAAAYKVALEAAGATPIQIWNDWQPSNSNEPPFNELGDYHPDSESARKAAVALLAEVEKVYT